MKNLKFASGVFLLLCVFTTDLIGKTIVPSKNYITKEINNISKFNSIFVLGSYEVEYCQNNDSKTKVTVYGPDNLIGLLEVKTINGELQISPKKNISIKGKENMKVRVTSPSLKQVILRGSGNINLINRIKGKTLNLNLIGSGNIDADNLEFTNFHTQLQGSGDVTLHRLKSKNVHIQLKGSGDVDIHKLESTDVYASSQGSGDIKLDCVQSSQVQAVAIGSGDIQIKGTSDKAIWETRGSGNINASALIAKEVTAMVVGIGNISCYATENLSTKVIGRGSIKYDGTPQKINK